MGEIPYDTVQLFTFKQLIDKMNSSGILDDVFNVKEPGKKPDYVRNLRNWVSHNRIMLKMEGCGYSVVVQSLHDLLPDNYRNGYRVALRSCSKDITVSEYFEYVPLDSDIGR